MPHRTSPPQSDLLGRNPALVSGTFVERCSGQLERLAAALDLDEVETTQLLNTFDLSTGAWGKNVVPAEADISGLSWVSELSNDHSPVEWSITLQQSTGDAELRFTVEAQPTDSNLSSARDAAMQLTRTIRRNFRKSMSIRYLRRIERLLMPVQPDKGAMMVAWHSFVSSKTDPAWKMYFDPRVQGPEHSSAVIEEALRLLGMPAAWDRLQQALSPRDTFMFLSLDLCADEDGARVKVYVEHPSATAAEVAAKHVAICPDASPSEIERFYRAMAGGSGGPYQGKSVVSTFAFTFISPDRPVGTVSIRADAYMPDDAEAVRRMQSYFNACGASPACLARYRKALAAVQNRPLEIGAGIHSWVSLKTKRGGSRQTTIYFSPELYGPVRLAGDDRDE